MVRKLALAVSIALGTLSIPAYALGLGDIDARSALNQNFDASIHLLSVAPGDVDSVRAGLASIEAFQRAGIDRPYFLSELKFEPTLLENGDTVIRVTSTAPVREPFLNFLLEVNWPKGRLVREYTVLLDPPTTTRQQAPRTQPATATRAQSTPTQASPVADESTDYRVKDSDTAWGIAHKFRPTGVSMEQMMMALLRTNPQAFIDDNLNRLRSGQILRLPTLAEINELTRAQARDAYRMQQDTWLAQRGERLQAAQQPAADGQGKAETAAATDKAELRIASPRPEGEGSAGAGADDAERVANVGDLKEKLLLARENAESSRQETEQLRGQIGEIEQRLADMQKLLSLKDAQLAQLQERVAQAESAEPPAPVIEEPALVYSSIGADTPVQEIAPGLEPAEPMTPPEFEMPPVVEPMPAPTPEPIPASFDEPLADTQPNGEERLANLLLEYLPFIAGGAVVIALLVLLMLRRKRSTDKSTSADEAERAPDPEDEGRDAAEQESILLDLDDSEMPTLSDDDANLEAGDSSFLSELSPSEVHNLQDETGEVDPVSEADVYIAYGRYQQAEDLLKQALAKEPERLSLKHKLLEVLYATRNAAGFAAVANGMVEAGQDMADEDAWAQAVSMGGELDPTNTLFRQGADVGTDAESSVQQGAVAQDDIDDIDLDLAELDLSGLEVGGDSELMTPDHVDSHSELLLDLDDLGSEPTARTEVADAAGDFGDLDLDFPDLDEKPRHDDPDTSLDDVDSLDLSDFSSFDGETEMSAEELQAQLEELSELANPDLDLSEFADNLDAAGPDENLATVVLDHPVGLDMSFDEGVEHDGGDLDSTDLDDLLGDGSGGNAEEVDTKLDLAQAYLDMGDREGAQGILEEVLAEGSDEQKAAAQRLVDRART